MRFLLICCCLAASLIGAEPSWRLTKYCKVVDEGGKKILKVQVPEEPKAVNRINCAFLDLDLKPYAGKLFEAKIRVRGQKVGEPTHSWNGVKFLLYFKDGKGRETWSGAELPRGTFDWRVAEFNETIPPDVQKGILRVGLQESSGTVEVDLSSLKYGERKDPEDAPAEPLSPEAEKEFAAIEARMRALILAGKSKRTEQELHDVVRTQRPDGSFASVDYACTNRSSWGVAKHLNLVLDLIKTRIATGKDNGFGEAARKGLAWWIQERPQSSNWWWNDMYVPQVIEEILIAGGSELFPRGDAVRDGALQVCRQAQLLKRYTGNNRVFVAANIFRRGLLAGNETVAANAAAVLVEEIRMAPTKNKTAWAFGGIRQDGCYHLHGPQLQFGNYGGEFLANIGYWSNIWAGTRFALTPEQKMLMRHLSFNGFQWVMWKGEMDLLACGRQLHQRCGEVKGKRTLTAFSRLGAIDPEAAAQYSAAIAGKLVGNKHFWNTDYMVHRRPDWYASVRMNSVRVRPIEDDTNGDNALGRYFSDGACLIYRSGDEYRDITGCWDWTRLPGTTLPAMPILSEDECRKRNVRIAGSIAKWSFGQKVRSLGETVFTGGVTNGTQGVAVFTQNLDGVQAKKGYFFDRNAIYELGADIQSDSPYEVATTVNVCIANGEVKSGKDWVWHDGVGYRGEGMKFRTAAFTGDWRHISGGIKEPSPHTQTLFEIAFSHGVKVRNGKYAVIILPGVTAEATASWNQGKILCNTSTLQAVEFADGNIGAIFYKPGTLGSFVTEQPGVFLICKDRIFAADPTQKLKEMKINGKNISLPQGEYAGSSVEVK